MKKILFIIVLFICKCAYAQPKYFEKVWEPWGYAHDALNIKNIGNGNFIVTGSEFNYDYSVPYIAIIDAHCNAVYFNKYPNIDDHTIIYDIVKKDTSYISTGVSFNDITGNDKIFLQTINDTCAQTELSYIPNDTLLTGAFGMSPTFDNKYVIGGFSIYQDPNLAHDPWVAYAVKTTLSGEVIWKKRYTADFDTTKDSYIWQILPIPQSSDMFYWGVDDIVTYTNPTQADVYMARADSAGTILWKQKFNFGSTDAIGRAQWTPDHKIVYCGACFTIETGGKRGCLVKTDTLGNTIWWHQMPEISSVEEFIIVNEGREYVLSGERYFGPPYHLDAAIIKTDSSGNILWKRYYGGPKHDYAYCIAPADDGGYLMMGRKDTTGSTALVYMVKTNCMGLLTEPTAAFAAYQTGDSPLEVAFQNQSQYVYPDSIDGGYYIWDFGDGSPPYVCGRGYAPCAGDVVLHNYATQGQYNATLKAIVCSDTSTLKQEISVVWTGAEEVAIDAPRISVLPNPAKDLLHIETLGLAGSGQAGMQFTLYDLTGKAVCQAVLSPNAPKATLKVGDLPEGMYFWTCTSNHHQAARSGKITILR